LRCWRAPAPDGDGRQDFGDYRRWLDAAGVDTSLVREISDKFTASFFCSTDQHNNQIASFYTGAMAHAADCRSGRPDRPTW
jgi:adenosine kinase